MTCSGSGEMTCSDSLVSRLWRLRRRWTRAAPVAAAVTITGALLLQTPTHHSDRQGSGEDSQAVETSLQIENTYLQLQSLLSQAAPLRQHCSSLVRAGGRCFCYLASSHPEYVMGQLDGHKFVCADLLPRQGCTVMSFGINNDFSFDTDMTDLGCTVHAFDPTMNRTSGAVSERLFFHPVGIAAQDGWVGHFPVLSYTGALERVGWKDRIVDYLKLDVEYSEWEVLEQQLTLGRLDSQLARVRQMTVEFHLTRPVTLQRKAQQKAGLAGGSGKTGVDISHEEATWFLRILNTLKQAGFTLVATTPYTTCKKLSISCLPYLYETLWINTKLDSSK